MLSFTPLLQLLAASVCPKYQPLVKSCRCAGGQFNKRLAVGLMWVRDGLLKIKMARGMLVILEIGDQTYRATT